MFRLLSIFLVICLMNDNFVKDWTRVILLSHVYISIHNLILDFVSRIIHAKCFRPVARRKGN